MKKGTIKMNNEKMEVGLFQENIKSTYCSKIAKTDEEKKALFNALEKCDILLNDIVGQDIEIKDIFCEEREIVDEKTGELKKKYRTILFDTDGKSYVTGSYGIYNVLKKIFAVYGLPSTWSNPIKVKVDKKKINDGKTSLTLTIL